MSSPRLATLVAIRYWILPALNAARVRSRSRCDRPPWSAGHVLAAALQRRGQAIDPDLGVAEDEKPIEPELVGQLEQRRDLVLLRDEVDHLSNRLHRLEVGPDRDVGGVTLHEAVADAKDGVRHGRAEEGGLALARCAGEDRLDVDDEAHVEHPIGLVEDHGVHAVELELPAADEIEHTAGRPDHDLRPALEPLDLLVHRGAAVDGNRAHAAELAEP